MPFNQKINQIIQARKERRLPQIEREIEFLNLVKRQIGSLDTVISTINRQIEEKSGAYYTMLQTDPTMEARFRMVSTARVRSLIDEQLEKLEILKRRFSRDSVQIAFVGYERQGKSRFLQSITGLGNKVIPAYSGTSCTGAVSVIHNKSNVPNGLEVHFEFYNLEQFLDIVKEKLHKFFPNRHFTLGSLNDIRDVDLSDFTTNDTVVATEFSKFRKAFVEHIDEYAPLVGHPKMISSDKAEIIQHVAQYEEFETIPEGCDPALFVREPMINEDGVNVGIWVRRYYKYVAVKSVNIYTQFVDPRIGNSKIVLVDTVGLGDGSNAARIEAEMFRVLREDCDAAVDVFKPNANGDSFNQNQNSVLANIGKRLADREPSRWIYYVLNRVQTGAGCNTHIIPEIKSQISNAFAVMQSVPVADVIDINAANVDEVNQQLISPLLDLITNNLDDIDGNMVKDANESNEVLYEEYKLMADAVAAVVAGTMINNSNEGKLFDRLYQNLSYSKYLRILDEENYALRKDIPCEQVSERLNEVINNLVDLVPDTMNAIYPDVERGDMDTNGIFVKHLNGYRNAIFEAFELVNTDVLIPLQEQVKDELIAVLFVQAKLGNIPLQGYDIEDGPSQAWLKALVAEKVDQSAYPKLYDMLTFILDYQLNIEGLIEYNVAKSLDPIDPMRPECSPMEPLTGELEEQAQEIWAEMVNRTTPIQAELRKWRDDFSLIPNHSFYARVHKFRDKMVFGDRETKDNIRDFYRDNRLTIWRDEFAQMETQDQAFGAWNKECRAITDMCVKNKFYLYI